MVEQKSIIIIYAPNIRGGGGLSLLKQLLPYCINCTRYFLVLHENIKQYLEVVPENAYFVRSDLKSRILAEFFVWRIAGNRSKIFCFHNLPALFGLRRNCHVYFHNLNMLEPGRLYNFDKWNFFRSKMEGVCLRTLQFRIEKIYSQSDLVSKMLKKHLTLDPTRYNTSPFYNCTKYIKSIASNDLSPATKSYKLVYLADGSPHKNHEKLFEAACLLEKIIPQLKISLTLKEQQFRTMLEKYPNNVVVNAGVCTHDVALNLMAKSDGLIFPSLIESLGLPLIEAQALGVKIISSELDYVRNVCEPSQTFNPESASSISRAVLRFYGISDPSKTIIMNNEEFVFNVLEKI